MAVYTKLDKEHIELILSNYSIGKLEKFDPIKEGVENTNYKIIVDKKKYILTIYEKRVDKKDLPFFCDITTKLFNEGFKCPLPINNRKGNMISDFANKKLTILSFIEGSSKENFNLDNCKLIGKETAKLHLFTNKMKLERKNSLSIESWKKMFIDMKNQLEEKDSNIKKIIEENLLEIEKKWPLKLPKGIIHGDLFLDNIIFEGDNINGIIDYTFACNDFYAYEIAICFNSLCFDKLNLEFNFNISKAKKFIEGYSQIRKLENEEKKNIRILSQGASIRFLLTRLFDSINTSENALAKIKDPNEYLKKLEFFRNEKKLEDNLFS